MVKRIISKYCIHFYSRFRVTIPFCSFPRVTDCVFGKKESICSIANANSIFVGLRIDEICVLTWQDIKLED